MYTLSIILIVFLSFNSIYSQFDLNEGDDCTGRTFSGKCAFLRKCPVVYQSLLKGKKPEKICSFPSSDDIIICCPNQQTSKDTSTTTTTTRKTTVTTTTRVGTGGLPLNSNDKRRISARKCEEYSKHVYAMVIPPTLTLDPQPTNISLCGIKSKKLIVGGTNADPKEFPHMAAVGFESGPNKISWLCGGTLVSELFVMTAAHCILSVNWGEPKWLRVGDLNLVKTTDDAKPQNRRIVEIMQHPQYKLPSQYHDIALLKMEREVTFNAYVRPACLPIQSQVSSGKAMATGWGLTDSDDETGSDDLLKVTLSIVSTETCNVSYRNDRIVFNRGIVENWQICAGEINKDTCQGDSGGPLAIYNTEYDCMYTIVGVTSLGKLCGINIPGVYTKVYGYLSWLEDIIWGQS